MNELRGVDSVVSLVYRGATAAGSWDPALSAIVDHFGATTACLRVSVRGARPFEFRFAAGRKVRREVLDEWERTQRGINVSPMPPLGVAQIRSYIDDFPDHPVTKELLEYDAAVALAYCFESLDGAEYILTISRGVKDPEFAPAEIAEFKRVGNHFGEAVRLRRELVRSNLTSQFQSQALDRLGVAGIIVDPFGSVVPLNAAAEHALASMECLKLQRHDRLVAINRSNDKELQEHLRRILAGEVAEGETFAMSLEREEGGRPVGLIVIAARSMCLASNREENCALLFLRDNDRNLAIETSLVQKLFSFTPAEANLAIGLASGRRLEEIEQQMSIRHNTARAHLRSIFVKADVTRQAELVCLLANSVAPLAQRKRGLDKVA